MNQQTVSRFVVSILFGALVFFTLSAKSQDLQENSTDSVVKKVTHDYYVSGFFKKGLKTTNDIIAATKVDQPDARITAREFKSFLMNEMNYRNSIHHYWSGVLTETMLDSIIAQAFYSDNFNFHFGDYQSMGRRKSDGHFVVDIQSGGAVCFMYMGQPIIKQACGNIVYEASVADPLSNSLHHVCPACPPEKECPPASEGNDNDKSRIIVWFDEHVDLLFGSYLWLLWLISLLFAIWLISLIIKKIKEIFTPNPSPSDSDKKRKAEESEEKTPVKKKESPVVVMHTHTHIHMPEGSKEKPEVKTEVKVDDKKE